MKEANLSLTHLMRPPVRSSTRPPLLILLHGLGSNEHDLFSLAPMLDPRLLIVSARAPHVRSQRSYAWFEVAFTPQGPVINPQQAESSRQALLRFIPEVTEAYGTDSARTYLMGFSQGAIMSASVALTEPELIAGAVLMSGRILPEIRPLIAAPERLSGLPLLVVHGLSDSVLPIHHAHASRTLLQSLPVQLDYHEYQMAHEVSEESLRDVSTWLTARIDRADGVG